MSKGIAKRLAAALLLITLVLAATPIAMALYHVFVGYLP